MTWAFCTCGWVGVGYFLDPRSMPSHVVGIGHDLRFKSFSQSHMSSDGVERLLTEARWGRV